MSHTALLEKLHEVALAIPFVEKRGENTHHHYNFAQAVDVTKTVRDELLQRGIIVIPGARGADHIVYKASGGKDAFLTTVALNYRFVDVESGAEIEIPWIGVGADTGGDKGVYKAYTGGLKYALLNLFLIPTSNDPERDELTSQGGGEQDKAHKDDERPAAPRIPVDRAQSILDEALKVGMATREDGAAPVFHPVFQALLAQVGVEKIGQLDVDAAEAVELFLEKEAQG